MLLTPKPKTKFIQTEGENKEQLDEKVNAYLREHEDIRVKDIAYQVAVTNNVVFHYAFILYEEKSPSTQRVGF